MESGNVFVKTQRRLHFSMSTFRGFSCSAKEFYFVVGLLCTISVLVTWKGFSVNEARNRLSGFEASKSYKGSFDVDSQVAFVGHSSAELVLKHSVQLRTVEKADYGADDPYSSNTEFCLFNSSELSLAPNEVASICFIYIPTCLGVSSAQVLLQTSSGGLLIQVKGFAVVLTYLTKPLGSLDVSSRGSWRRNSSFSNPFEGTLFLESATAFMYAFSGTIREADELTLKVGIFQASTIFMTVLDANESVQIGNYFSKWISVKNPSMLLLPHSALVANKSFGLSRYIFSVAENAIFEVFIHPLEIIRIEVSGPECGLDGFQARNFRCFNLLPGQAVRFQMPYQTALNGATVHRNPELPLAIGIPEIPMKASSNLWMWMKKPTLLLLFTAALLYLLVCPFLKPEEFASPRNSFLTAIRAFNPLNMHLNLVISSAMSSKVKVFLRREELLLFESIGRFSDVNRLGQRHVNTHEGHYKKTWSILTKWLKSSSVENSDTQKGSNSQNLRGKAGNEKGRKRRKKKTYEADVVTFEVLTSQSSKSLPSSSLSPVASRNTYAEAPGWQHIKSKASKSFCKVNAFDNEWPSRSENHNLRFSAQEKPTLMRKVAGKDFRLPCGTFCTGAKKVTTWRSYSSYLASTSKLPLHARAPGHKSHDQRAGELDEMTCLKEKFTYDIWADHLFGPPPSYQSKVLSDNSSSLFVRDPQTVMKNSHLLKK